MIAVAAVTVVACSSSRSTPPPMTPEIEAGLTARAIERACPNGCAATIYVRDQLLTIDTEVGQERPMPDTTRLAIADELPGVRFVGGDQSLFDQNGRIDGGRGILITVGPVEDLAPGVVGVEVGITPALMAGHGQILQFRWTGDDWSPATSDDTGVTVTSWVS